MLETKREKRVAIMPRLVIQIVIEYFFKRHLLVINQFNQFTRFSIKLKIKNNLL